MIVGQNQGYYWSFISSLQLQKSMLKGYNIYVIVALNEKGVAEGVENLPMMREFADFFPKDLPGMSLESDL
jgi:hypothetical protein